MAHGDKNERIFDGDEVEWHTSGFQRESPWRTSHGENDPEGITASSQG